MFCSKCGKANVASVSFCRNCGTDLNLEARNFGDKTLAVKTQLKNISGKPIANPDELTSRGIRDVIIGDGFFMVAIILGLLQSSVSSFLWLLLLIPAFFFFGSGIADVLHAKQIRRKQKETISIAESEVGELPPARATLENMFEKVASGELETVPSVTEKTTQNLRNK